MANWSNVRLIAVGHERDLAELRRLAKPYLAEARKPPAWMRPPRGAPCDPPDPLFTADDGIKHSCNASTRFPTLRFLVVWGDPNSNSFGSAYVRKGRASVYELSDRRRSAIYSRWRRKHGASPDDDDDAYAWDAFSEMMDVAERRWDACIDPGTSRRPRGRR